MQRLRISRRNVYKGSANKGFSRSKASVSNFKQKNVLFLTLLFRPLDEWNIHEQLCLASAVACSGDQNWMSVSRSLKGIVHAYSSRPPDWFHAKGCATQYGKLLESVETPKRKKVN